jgi:cobalamin biosynthetic protein CobC
MGDRNSTNQISATGSPGLLPGASILHGGSLERAREAFPDAPEPWLDLSTGINPLAYPLPDISPAAWARLPERGDVLALEAAAAAAYGASDPRLVAAAPGTQALLQLLPRMRPASRVAVLSPTYGEHAHVWRSAGHAVEEVSDFAQLDGADVAIVTNPNNPDGRVVTPGRLAELASRLGERGGLLIVDEAFADANEKNSIVPTIDGAMRGLVVFRSFGKFYGLAGVRLGFAVAGREMAERVRAALGPWAVSGPAVEIGRTALSDETWRVATRGRLVRDSERLARLLRGAEFDLAGGTPLFLLAEAEDAPARYEALGRAGILVRRFDGVSWRLRFGLPGGEAEWARLEAALR